MDMNRIMGILTLKAPVYRQIAEDANATQPAGIIVAVIALLAGFARGLVNIDPSTGQAMAPNFVAAIIAAVLAVVFALIGWFVSAWVLAFVAKWFGGKTNTQEMLRVTGFVEIFSIVGVLAALALITPVLACIAGLVGFVVAILKLVGYIIGVREAAEFTTGNAVITAIVAAIVNFLIVVFVGGAITAVVVGAMALTGAVTQ